MSFPTPAQTKALPQTMPAIVFDRPGPPEVLQLAELPLPVPGPSEVLIKVAAAGVNRPDCLQRKGLYPAPPGASPLLGLEVAGTIAALGPGVAQEHLGRQVTALLSGGGYAGYARAALPLCLEIPQGFSLLEAAALPEAAFTVWSNLFMTAALKPGERLLVHGGASGIGSFALSLAKALGIEAYATAGSDEKCQICEKLGARRAINYRKEDFAEALAPFVEDRGLDVILDMVGAPYLARNLALLGSAGRLVLIAFLGGPVGELDLRPILTKRLTITGATLRGRELAFKAAVARELLEKVWPLCGAGQLRPLIYKSLPLARAAEAHQLLEQNKTYGKLVLSLS